ncbi:HET domain containing protein [Hyaloscypha variabilis]
MEIPVHDPEHDDDDYWDESSSLSSQSFMQYQDTEECSACHRPNTATFMDYWHCTLVELENAASQNGCIQCQPIYELIKLFINNLWQCRLRISNGVRGREDVYVLGIFRLHSKNCRHFSATNNILKKKISEPNSTKCDILKEVPIKSPFLGNTGSVETLQCIKKWIEKCDSEHTLCAPTTHSAQLHGPRRILDLRLGKVRLREDHQEEYSYACLSHCWGNGAYVPKTVAVTLEAFKKNIPLEILTKTFRDAIDLCRRLDIQFLWIDSLCIKQDDAEDWKSQAPKMAGIYENSILTIAASMSADGSGGLYAETKHPNYLSADGLSIQEKRPQFPMGSKISLKEWPLLQRGWVFQERKLSRRMIHFGAEEVQRIGGGIDLKVLPKQGANSLSSTWRNYVRMYSELQLTFEKDKLVALSGIAERMAKMFPDDRYIAGLWEKTLLLDLTWQTYFEMEVARPSSFRAPTWSWASTKSAVHWIIGNYSVVKGVEVVDVSCPAAYTGNVFSEDDDENSGLTPTITIRGPIMAARFSQGTNDWPGDGSLTAEDYERDYYCELKFVEEHAVAFEGFEISFQPDYLFHMPGRYCVAPDSELFVLPFAIDVLQLNGLLLRKREGTPFYERLGLVEFAHSNWSETVKSLLTHVYSLPLSDITII